MNLYTTKDLAKRYRTSPRAVTKRALRRGIEPAKTIGRNHLWTAKQAEKLK